MCGLFQLTTNLLQGAFYALLIAGGLVLAVRTSGRSRARRRPDPLSRSIALLNERYARGSIDRDEYLERRAFLD